MSLRDRIVRGILDETAREKLLQTEDLTLKKCINLCRLLESRVSHLKSLGVSSSTQHDVHIVTEKKHTRFAKTGNVSIQKQPPQAPPPKVTVM